MEKFLITKRSQNRITGPILVTTSPRVSCPHICPLRKSSGGGQAGACYAEHGFLGGFIWSSLDRLPIGGSFQKGQIKVYGFESLCKTIQDLPEDTIWRHNQAGDLAGDDGITINRVHLKKLCQANKGRRGFTYTHYDVIGNKENAKAVKNANDAGFTINLSGNSPAHADQLAELGIAPVTTIVSADTLENTFTPAGRRIVICPARRIKGMTCKSCGICARKRTAIIGFPALGKDASKFE